MYYYSMITSLLFLVLLQQTYEQINLDWHQTDYHVYFERMDVVSVDKRYINHMKIVTFKYNRTCAAFNMSFNYKENIYSKVSVIFQAYKFASNEYRLFPIRVQLMLCDVYDKHIAGMGMPVCGNVRGCPNKKNYDYLICNFALDQSRLPPFIPTGRYMAITQGFLESSQVWEIQVYVEISRPIGK